ncbi:MAG: DUF4142 domain-containing protein [Ginsengibacter sp.]
MKRISIYVIAALLVVGQSCNNNDESKKDSVEKANDANAIKDTTDMSAAKKDTMGTMAVNDDVADFAVKAANGGMMEVDLGKLAEQKGVSKGVKDFGAMMVKEHSKLNDELKSLAAAKNITLPTTVGSDMQKQIDDLSKDTAREFDKNYIDKMVSDHNDDIDLFEKTAKNSKDSAFRNFAVKALPTLYKHLGAAKAIVKSRG